MWFTVQVELQVFVKEKHRILPNASITSLSWRIYTPRRADRYAIGHHRFPLRLPSQWPPGDAHSGPVWPGRYIASLALAREKLLDAKRAVARGESPAHEKQCEKRRLSAAKTFGDLTGLWLVDARMAGHVPDYPAGAASDSVDTGSQERTDRSDVAEIDFENATWMIPMAWMKGRNPHVVYLSRQAVDIDAKVPCNVRDLVSKAASPTSTPPAWIRP